MLYLSANAIRNMQCGREINSAESKYWHTKAFGKLWNATQRAKSPTLLVA